MCVFQDHEVRVVEEIISDREVGRRSESIVNAEDHVGSDIVWDRRERKEECP